MPESHRKDREKAFRLRVDRKPIAEVSRTTGVSRRTLSRWEHGWVDAEGRSHPGWKAELEKAWKDAMENELHYGLLLKVERLKAYEELARLAVARVKEMFPTMRARTAADAKALLSEIRELCRLIAVEKGEFRPSPRTLVAVRTDITLEEIAERYRNAHAAEEGNPGPAGDGERPGGAGGDPSEPGGE